MRARIVMAALLAAGCSPSADQAPAGGNTATPASVASPAPVPATAATVGAKRTAQLYFDRLRAHDYRAAYRLWGGNGADTRGTLKDFIAANGAFTRYDGTAGDPTAPKVTQGQEYITVESGVDAQPKGQTKTIRRTGAVMLRRPARADGGADDGSGWTIWGTDIRERHCRSGQQAKAFGCV